jgi:hypothetical protein
MNSSLKKLLIILLVLTLIFSLTLALAACNDEDPTTSPTEEEEEEETVDEDILIQNGDFADVTGSTYPKSATGWTGSVGSSSSSTQTPSGSENLITGVINLEEAAYNENKGKWGDLANPGKQDISDEDNNVLMIYNKTLTVYKYTNSFSTVAGKYYKVTVHVKTNITDGAGAYVYLTGGAYAAFEKINTEGIWQDYTAYIEGSLIESSTITVTIALGYGNKDGGNMTQGYAFFDNIVAEEIEVSEYAEQTLSDRVALYSQRTPDSRMEYSSGTSLPYSASGYSGKTGTGAGGSAPYYSTDVTKGIVSTNTELWSDTYGTNPGNSNASGTVLDTYGDKVLMVYNKNATAAGYAGNRKVRFEIGNYYKLSVDVYVALETGQEMTEFKGATLRLTGTDNFEVKYIDTASAWVTYSFYVEANEVRNKDFTLELWLGQGGKDDTDTLTEGIAFFDNVVLTEVTEGQYDTQKTAYDANPNNYAGMVVSLLSTNPNLVPNYNLTNIDAVTGLPVEWSYETTSDEVIVNDGDVEYKLMEDADLNADEWTTALQEKYFGLSENPLYPYNTMSPVFLVHNTIPVIFGMGLDDELDIMPNLHYRMAIWLKTSGIDESLGVNVKLVTGSDDDMETLSSFTTINTEEYENYQTNDYVELVFYVQGHELEDNSLRLLIEMGSGTAFDPTKYVEGYLMLSNVNMEQITYTEYSSASSGTYTKLYSFAENSGTVSNGNFNALDLEETEVDENGALTDKPGVPKSWTASSTTEDNVVSGIINVDNAALLTELGLNDVYNDDGWTEPYPVDFGSPCLLMIQSKPASGDYDGTVEPFGYESKSFTLSKASYYIVKVYVKTVGDAVANIILAPTTDTDPEDFISIDTDGQWEEFVFVVETGRASVTTKVELYLGNKDGDDVSGTVFFDSVSYQAIDEEAYNAYVTDDRLIALSYQVETFDNYTSTSTGYPTPSNWTGSIGNTSLSSDSNKGVLSNITGDVTECGVLDEEENLIEDSKINNDTLRDIIFNIEAATTIGDNVLMVNNRVPTAYAYKTSSETLTKASYYEVSVWVFTYYVPEGKSARVMLSIGEDTFTFSKVNTSEFIDGVETPGVWTKYSYYLKTDPDSSTSSVYLTLGLGKYLASDTEGAKLVSGYAFFDNVLITAIEEEDFNAQNELFLAAKADGATTEQKAYLDFNSIIKIDAPDESTASDPTEEEPEEEEESGFNWLMATYISSAIIGGVIVIVVIIIIIKKLAPKIAARRKLKFKKTTYDRTTSGKGKSTDKTNRYDKYKD